MQYKAVDTKKGGRAWEIVRWTYDPTTKRSKPESLGRVKDSWTAVPQTILDKCHDDGERGEIYLWWRALKEGQHKERLAAAASAPRIYSMPLIAEAVETGLVGDAAAVAIWAEVDRLTKALRKAGLKRPTKPKAAPAADDDAPALPLG